MAHGKGRAGQSYRRRPENGFPAPGPFLPRPLADTLEQARDEFQDAVICYYRAIAKHVAPKKQRPVPFRCQKRLQAYTQASIPVCARSEQAISSRWAGATGRTREFAGRRSIV